MTIEARDVEGGVRILSLNRPPANAINRQLLNDLRDACKAANREPSVRAIVVTGAGKFFSAGLDLNEVLSSQPPNVFGSTIGSADGVFDLWTLSKPTVAMVNGHAIAGGGVICLACDIRIAAGGGLKIGLNEVPIGLSFPTGAFELVVQALGIQQARRVMLEGQLYDVETARQLGMIDEIVPAADLERMCVERARLLGSYNPAAYEQTKRGLQRDAVHRVLNEPDDVRRTTLALWGSAEARRRLTDQLSRLGKKG